MSDHQLRRCVVCGQREQKRTLARFAKQGEQVVFDGTQAKEGRGVYVHATPECFSRLTEVRFWERSLSRKGGKLNRENILGAVADARAVLKVEFNI